MPYKTTFQRYELKYLLTESEKKALLQIMQPYMRLDTYGHTTIRNIYFDTADYRLIRHSLDRPVYKEKLRIRSYKTASPGDEVFVELKKKYKSVVYKRRLSLPEQQIMASFHEGVPLPVHSQIADEIKYFREYYKGLRPVVFLSYEREAFFGVDDEDFRVTFDENILYRDNDLSLGSEIYGEPLLKNGQTLMEIKTSGGMPLWMSHELSRLKLYQASFSKYGRAFQCLRAERCSGEQRRLLYAG